MKRLSILITLFLAAVTHLLAALPDATLTTLDGSSVNAKTIANDGKPYVVSFFATWCKPCLRELNAIAEVYPDWQEETGMRLIAVSIDDARTAPRVKPLVESEGWDYEVLLDNKGELQRALGVKMVPFLIIADGNSEIVYRHQGYADGGEEDVIEKIRQLTADKK